MIEDPQLVKGELIGTNSPDLFIDGKDIEDCFIGTERFVADYTGTNGSRVFFTSCHKSNKRNYRQCGCLESIQKNHSGYFKTSVL